MWWCLESVLNFAEPFSQQLQFPGSTYQGELLIFNWWGVWMREVWQLNQTRERVWQFVAMYLAEDYKWWRAWRIKFIQVNINVWSCYSTNLDPEEWVFFCCQVPTFNLMLNSTVCSNSRPWCTLSEYFKHAVRKCHNVFATQTYRDPRRNVTPHMHYPTVRGWCPELPCPPHTETYRRQATEWKADRHTDRQAGRQL